jgi:hypothetical protein
VSDNRLILGVYLDPHVWFTKEDEIVNAQVVTPAKCLEIVFHKHLPNGIEVCVQRQGYIVAAIPEDLMSIRVSETNAANLLPSNAARFAHDFFNATLYLLNNYPQSIGLADIWIWRNREGAELVTIAQEQAMPVLNQHNWLAFDAGVRMLAMTVGQLSETDAMFRISLPLSRVDKAFELLFADPDYLLTWQLMALLNKAISSTRRGEFAEAHILSWAVIEKLIQVEWDEFMENTNETFDDGTKSINSKRKNFLNGRDFTAAVRIEILELAKVIPYEVYKRLGPIRKVRNDWIHNLGPVSVQDCRDCYTVARDLLSTKVGFTIRHPGGTYIFDGDLPRS